jgi:hypothetical protein
VLVGERAVCQRQRKELDIDSDAKQTPQTDNVRINGA